MSAKKQYKLIKEILKHHPAITVGEMAKRINLVKEVLYGC